MKKKVIIISILFLIIACSKNDEYEYRDLKIESINLDSIISIVEKNPMNKSANYCLWSYLARIGQNEKLLTYASKTFHFGSKDFNKKEISITAAYYIANTYVSINIPDSARKYLDFICNHIDKDHPINIIYYNTEAEYALKYEMDYPKAMKYLSLALELSRKYNDKDNQATILGNMANIFASRKDTAGIIYAKKAYSIAYELNNNYLMCLSSSILSYMEMLASKYISAEKHSMEALSLANKTPELNYLIPSIYINLGDIYTGLNFYEKANLYYIKAKENISDQDLNTMVRMYASYAKLLLLTEKTELAKNYYLKSKDIAKKIKNLDYTLDILAGLSKTYEKLGNKDSTIYYYSLYFDTNNKIFNVNKEKEFSQLFLDYEKVRYENQLQQKELKLIKSRRLIYIIATIIIIITGILLFQYSLMRKKDKMYTTLVEQHQKLLKQQELLKQRAINDSEKNENRNKSEFILFKKLDELMNTDKIYRHNDITIESLAETLGTNRTYLSVAINKYAGNSLPNYINSFRINEAISMISDPENNLSLKEIYKMVGYNSISSFYRAFQKETGCSPLVYREKILQMQKDGKSSLE